MKNKIVIICLLILSTNSCKKDDFDIQNLSGNRIICLGHGGMGIGNTYPMNSYESILKCLSLGMDGTEFDVQMTKDSVLVLFHDIELSGKTNLKGHINLLNWSELKNAYYTENPYLNYAIISLEQLFASIDNIENYTFTFDCKLYTQNDVNQYYLSYMNALVKIIQKYQLEKNVCIESQSEDFLKLLKGNYPNYKLFIYPSSFEDGLDKALKLNLFGITISSRDITKEQIKLAHDSNVRVAIWNTHSSLDNQKAIKKSPDYIQTDNVANLVKKLK